MCNVSGTVLGGPGMAAIFHASLPSSQPDRRFRTFQGCSNAMRPQTQPNMQYNTPIRPSNKIRSAKSDVMAPPCLSPISGRREEVKGYDVRFCRSDFVGRRYRFFTVSLRERAAALTSHFSLSLCAVRDGPTMNRL